MVLGVSGPVRYVYRLVLPQLFLLLFLARPLFRGSVIDSAKCEMRKFSGRPGFREGVERRDGGTRDSAGEVFRGDFDRGRQRNRGEFCIVL